MTLSDSMLYLKTGYVGLYGQTTESHVWVAKIILFQVGLCCCLDYCIGPIYAAQPALSEPDHTVRFVDPNFNLFNCKSKRLVFVPVVSKLFSRETFIRRPGPIFHWIKLTQDQGPFRGGEGGGVVGAFKMKTIKTLKKRYQNGWPGRKIVPNIVLINDFESITYRITKYIASIQKLDLRCL